MCDVTHNNLFGLGLTDAKILCRCIVFILVYIIVLSYQCSYDIICVMLVFWFPPFFDEIILLRIFKHYGFHVGIR